MTKSVKLGAPSLTGKDANDLVAEVFADAKFPLTVVVKNHMPRDVAFPEVKGLFLRHVANEKESQKKAVIESYDLFHRLASSIEQVAELNRYQLAVTISDGEIPSDKESPAPASGDGAGAGEADKKTDPAADDKKPSDGLSYDQLKDALKAKGIEFAANAKKDVLAALLDATPASGDGAGTGEADKKTGE